MIENNVKENIKLNLSDLWNFSEIFSHCVLASDIKKNFLPEFNNFLVKIIKTEIKILEKSLKKQISIIKKRSTVEKDFWLKKIETIKNYSREQAINELIKTQKIYEKLNQIDKYINGIS